VSWQLVRIDGMVLRQLRLEYLEFVDPDGVPGTEEILIGGGARRIRDVQLSVIARYPSCRTSSLDRNSNTLPVVDPGDVLKIRLRRESG